MAARAHREKRVLLTEDKDFGQLVYAEGARTQGVVLVRFPSHLRQEMIASVVEVVRRFQSRLSGQFTIVQPGKVRFSKLSEE